MSVMTTVSMWRCKCGSSINVVGERELDKVRGRIVVACPQCGTQQLMHVDKIISIDGFSVARYKEFAQREQ
jgi:hypothetical protein